VEFDAQAKELMISTSFCLRNFKIGAGRYL